MLVNLTQPKYVLTCCCYSIQTMSIALLRSNNTRARVGRITAHKRSGRCFLSDGRKGRGTTERLEGMQSNEVRKGRRCTRRNQTTCGTHQQMRPRALRFCTLITRITDEWTHYTGMISTIRSLAPKPHHLKFLALPSNLHHHHSSSFCGAPRNSGASS